MGALEQRRISEILFKIDGNLNVLESNRGFLRFFNIVEGSVNLSKFLDKTDCDNFKHFLKKFNPNSKNHTFLAYVNARENDFKCLFFVSKPDSGDVYNVELQELAYAKEIFERAIMESREYSVLLSNFDSLFFVYLDGKYIFQNTKALTNVFEGNALEFRTYLTDVFNIDNSLKENNSQFEALDKDVSSNISDMEYRFLCENGEFISIRTKSAAIRKQSRIIGLIVASSKVVLNSGSYAQNIDGLTGLYNKKTITDLAKKKIDVSHQTVSLIIVDLDNFKECNDSFGHAFGDQVLVTVSNVLKEAVAGIGIAGRIGGDEFLCIIEKTEEEELRTVLRSIKLGVQWGIPALNPESVVTCSMGVAKYPVNAGCYDDLFAIADKCLYIAKTRGRNCYVIYKPEIHDKVLVSNEKKNQDMSNGKLHMENALATMEIMRMFQTDDKSRFEKIALMLIDFMTISSITVYDANLKRRFYEGACENDFRKKYLKDEEKYFAYFNEYGFFMADNLNILDTVNKEKFAMYVDNNISSTLEVVVRDKNSGKRLGLICFDKLKPSRTFDRDKIPFALISAFKFFIDCGYGTVVDC